MTVVSLISGTPIAQIMGQNSCILYSLSSTTHAALLITGKYKTVKPHFENSERVMNICSEAPIPFYDFTLHVVLSLFSAAPLPPKWGEYFLPALGEPPVKRERTTNNVISRNETGLAEIYIMVNY